MTVRIELRRDSGRIGPGSSPWIRSRQIAREMGPPDPSSLAEVYDRKGDRVAWGLYSPESELRVRLLSFGEAPPKDDWLEARLSVALEARQKLGLGIQRGEQSRSTGYREVNSEGDGLPGLTIDRYGDLRVVQISTAPMHVRADAIQRHLQTIDDRPLLFLRPQTAAEREGFPSGVEGPSSESLSYLENGLRFSVPAPPGQKTGGYHDQRDNRRRFAELAAERGGPMLDLGCHVGGFAIHAAARGIDAVAVDRSELALKYGQRNAEANGLSNIRWKQADMFGPLSDAELHGPFGSVVFDPPRIANQARDAKRAIQAMARTLGILLPRILPGGLLAICSCSHHLGYEGLDRALLSACHQRGGRPRNATEIASWGPGPDHPIALGHETGRYLRVRVYRLS